MIERPIKGEIERQSDARGNRRKKEARSIMGKRERESAGEERAGKSGSSSL